MAKVDRHNEDYRKHLASVKLQMASYLSKHTGYFVVLGITKDTSVGYCYRAKISLSKNMDIFASYVLKSPCQKSKLRDELKEYILYIDWKSKKNGQTTVITKQTKSTALSLECAECQRELAVSNFHRNLKNSSLFKERHSYAYTCKTCLNNHFVKLLTDSDVYTAMCYVCAILDRPFTKDIVDNAVEKAKKPTDIANIYLKLINLTQCRGKSFADSNIFMEDK